MNHKRAILRGGEGKRNSKTPCTSCHLLIQDIAQVPRDFRIHVDQEIRDVRYIKAGKGERPSSQRLHGEVHFRHLDPVSVGGITEARTHKIQDAGQISINVNDREHGQTVAAVSSITLCLEVDLAVVVSIVTDLVPC